MSKHFAGPLWQCPLPPLPPPRALGGRAPRALPHATPLPMSDINSFWDVKYCRSRRVDCQILRERNL